jgi:16S rRNA (guanine966-N2)-methyltransferase
MRVIAGQYRSRPLTAPPGDDTRPTSDRLRETLFNVIALQVAGSTFVDVYAGSGAVGIEALSRGARQVYFLESGKKAARTIRENLRSLSISEGFEVMEREAAQSLRLLEAQGVSCEVIFVDPPYAHHGAYEQTLGFISQSELLAQGGMVIAEHDKRHDPGDTFGALTRYRTLNQGDAVLSFYKR